MTTRHRGRWAGWLLVGSGLATAFLAPSGCSQNPEVGLGAPCATLLKDDCGGACEEDGDCPRGTYCGAADRCTADCVVGSEYECETGNCSAATGKCSGGLSIGSGGEGGQGAGGDDGAGCIDVQVDFAPEYPTVMLLIDQSGSMDELNFGESVKDAEAAGSYAIWDCGDGPDGDSEDDEYWRWNVVRNVLLNPETGVVKPLESNVRFGLALYTSYNGSIDPGTNLPDPDRVCPMLEQVPIGLNRHADMLSTFVCSDIRLDTPTGESLSAVAAQLTAFDEPGPKLIVLATDGQPDSCDCPNFGNEDPLECRDSGATPPNRPSDLVKADVVARAAAIRESGIEVHVINVSRPDNEDLAAHLQEVATAGGGMLFEGFDPGAIRTAFEEIIDGARSCFIDLDGSIAAGKENSGRVLLDGEPLGFQDPDGWERVTASRIELVGEACRTIKTGEHDLSITFPCGTFVPITK